MTGDPNSRLMLLFEAKLAADAAVLKLARGAFEPGLAAAARLREATVLLRRIASLGVSLSPGPEPTVSGGTITGQAPSVREQLARHQELKFKTHDLVVLRGALYGERTLQVSGLNPMNLGKRPFLVLKILARHAQANPGAYLSVNEIVNALREDPARQKAGIWGNLIHEDVHRIVLRLRKAIGAAGGNPRLIERSSSYAAGYRLSTPSWNIFLEDLDME